MWYYGHGCYCSCDALTPAIIAVYTKISTIQLYYPTQWRIYIPRRWWKISYCISMTRIFQWSNGWNFSLILNMRSGIVVAMYMWFPPLLWLLLWYAVYDCNTSLSLCICDFLLYYDYCCCEHTYSAIVERAGYDMASMLHYKHLNNQTVFTIETGCANNSEARGMYMRHWLVAYS